MVELSLQYSRSQAFRYGNQNKRSNPVENRTLSHLRPIGPRRARLPVSSTTTLPSCPWPRRIFPSLSTVLAFHVHFFIVMQVQLSRFRARQLMVELSLQYSRFQAFRYGNQIKRNNPVENRTLCHLRSIGPRRARLPISPTATLPSCPRARRIFPYLSPVLAYDV